MRVVVRRGGRQLGGGGGAAKRYEDVMTKRRAAAAAACKKRVQHRRMTNLGQNDDIQPRHICTFDDRGAEHRKTQSRFEMRKKEKSLN